MALSSAYKSCFEMVGGMSAMYTLKRIGASTEPWGRPLRGFLLRLRSPDDVST